METTASNKLLGIKNIMGTYIKYIHSTVIYKMTHILYGNKKYTFYQKLFGDEEKLLLIIN